MTPFSFLLGILGSKTVAHYVQRCIIFTGCAVNICTAVNEHDGGIIVAVVQHIVQACIFPITTISDVQNRAVASVDEQLDQWEC
jgi:hypothetical protein